MGKTKSAPGDHPSGTRAFTTPRRAVLAVFVTVAVVTGIGLPIVAHRSAEQWEAAVTHLDQRLAAIEQRFPAGWDSLDEEIEALTASTTLSSVSSDKPYPYSVIRATYPPEPTVTVTPPASSTPSDLAWWRGLVHSNREKSYPLDLGDGYGNLLLKIRQERRWLASEVQVSLVSAAPLDDSRATALEEAVAEGGFELSFLHQPTQ